MKTHYRTFNMGSDEVTPGDDFGMMKEMLRRRFTRLVKEAPRPPPSVADGETSSRSSERPGEGQVDATVQGELVGPSPGDADASLDLSPLSGGDENSPAWPDLVLIDGGKGQLDAARAALAEIGIADVALVGIAKGRDRDAGRETFFMPDKAPIRLPPRDPALYFVQRLRDEAHRFAIGAHRAKRKRELTKSPLDEIPGIGPSRKRALLHHFGTMKAIQRAALDDLMRAPGVNAATARTVYDFFRASAG